MMLDAWASFMLIELVAKESASRARDMFLGEPADERMAIMGCAMATYERSVFWYWMAKEHARRAVGL